MILNEHIDDAKMGNPNAIRTLISYIEGLGSGYVIKTQQPQAHTIKIAKIKKRILEETKAIEEKEEKVIKNLSYITKSKPREKSSQILIKKIKLKSKKTRLGRNIVRTGKNEDLKDLSDNTIINVDFEAMDTFDHKQ